MLGCPALHLPPPGHSRALHGSDAMALPPPHWRPLGRERKELLRGARPDPPHCTQVPPGGLLCAHARCVCPCACLCWVTAFLKCRVQPLCSSNINLCYREAGAQKVSEENRKTCERVLESWCSQSLLPGDRQQQKLGNTALGVPKSSPPTWETAPQPAHLEARLWEQGRGCRAVTLSSPGPFSLRNTSTTGL